MPVTVHTASPINATKASGVTPKTAPAAAAPSQVSQSYAPPTTTAGAAAPPAPAPAARPPPPTSAPTISMYAPPATTAAPVYPPPQQSTSPFNPTPTQASGPPPPQPSAVPEPPTAASLPPPPKAGEKLGPEHLQTASATPTQMPPQISYAPPPAPTNPGAYTSTIPLGPSGPQLTSLGDVSHPPGYQQNANATEFSSAQRAAHHASVADNPSSIFGGGGSGYAGDDSSIWDTAKKWATSAGESLAAAENEVWKKINKE